MPSPARRRASRPGATSVGPTLVVPRTACLGGLCCCLCWLALAATLAGLLAWAHSKPAEVAPSPSSPSGLGGQGPSTLRKPADGACVGDYLNCPICNNTLVIDTTTNQSRPIGFLDDETFACPNAVGANWTQLSEGIGYNYPGMDPTASYLQAGRGDSVVMAQSTNAVGSNRNQTLFCQVLRNPGNDVATLTRRNGAIPRMYTDENSQIFAMTGLSYMQFNTQPTWEAIASTTGDDGKIACGMCLQLFGEVTDIDQATGFLKNNSQVRQIKDDETLIVMVADQCYDGFKDRSDTPLELRQCGSGHLDLDVFDEATSANANRTWWKAVPCPVELQDPNGTQYTVSIEAGFSVSDVANQHTANGGYNMQFMVYSSKYPIERMEFMHEPFNANGNTTEMTYNTGSGWTLNAPFAGFTESQPFYQFRLTSVQNQTIECRLFKKHYLPPPHGVLVVEDVPNPEGRATDADGHVSPLNCQFGDTYAYPPAPPPFPPAPPPVLCIPQYTGCGASAQSPYDPTTPCCPLPGTTTPPMSCETADDNGEWTGCGMNPSP